jgi:hypothetical protein
MKYHIALGIVGYFLGIAILTLSLSACGNLGIEPFPGAPAEPWEEIGKKSGG